MGGRGDKAPPTAHDRVPICRDDHRALHLGEWTFAVDGGWVTGTNADGSTFERALLLDDDNPSPAWWTDGKLGLYWEQAGASVLKHRATIAHIFKQRWGWGQGWAQRAADAMGGGAHGTGQQISARTVRRAGNIWDLWGGDEELMKKLGSMTVAYAIAGAEDAQAALVIAEKGLATDKKAGEIVREIEGKTANPVQSERCVCPDCGTEHKKGD